MVPFGDEAFDAVCCFGALLAMRNRSDRREKGIEVLRQPGGSRSFTSYADLMPADALRAERRRQATWTH